MIYIAITIFLFNILVVFFKLFEKYNINNLQALVANYFISACLAFYFIEDNINIKNIIKSDWLIHAVLIGILFITIFNIYAFIIFYKDPNFLNSTFFEQHGWFVDYMLCFFWLYILYFLNSILYDILSSVFSSVL